MATCRLRTRTFERSVSKAIGQHDVERRAASERDSALVVFARAPRPGKVKTRLALAIGHDAAAKVYSALLTRALELAAASRFRALYLFAADRSELDYFSGRLDQSRWQVRLQCEGDIGQRMGHASERVLSKHEFLVITGSDVADATLTDLNNAHRILSHGSSRIVLGPSLDGGYWLIGLHRPQPALFEGIPWSTGEVCRVTQERIAALGLNLSTLETRHDIDEYDDLAFLVE